MYQLDNRDRVRNSGQKSCNTITKKQKPGTLTKLKKKTLPPPERVRCKCQTGAFKKIKKPLGQPFRRCDKIINFYKLAASKIKHGVAN